MMESGKRTIYPWFSLHIPFTKKSLYANLACFILYPYFLHLWSSPVSKPMSFLLCNHTQGSRSTLINDLYSIINSVRHESLRLPQILGPLAPQKSSTFPFFASLGRQLGIPLSQALVYPSADSLCFYLTYSYQEEEFWAGKIFRPSIMASKIS